MNQSRTIRLPVNVLKEMNVYLKAFRYLANSLDHEPTTQEVANHMDKPVSKVERLMRLSDQLGPGSYPVSGDGENNVFDSIADEDEPTLPYITHQEGIAHHLSIWLEKLDGDQRELISRRFGLGGYDPSNLSRAARAMKIPREKAKLLEEESLVQLKKMADMEGISIDAIFF
jgi:RNA polymerase nonessential primary-like sigma factor